MRVNKLAIYPSLGVAAVDLFLFHNTLDVFSQLSNDLVLFIKQSHARVQLGHKQ